MVFVVWLVSLVFSLPVAGHAYLWDNVLTSTRGAPWENMLYEPPDTSTWTHCTGSPVSAPSSSAEIQSIIDSCGSTTDAGNRKVVLNAGTFTLSTGFVISKSNLVVEGQGHTTELVISTGRGCNSHTGICVVTGSAGNFYYEGGGTPNIQNITSGATQGSTQIVVADATNLNVNDGIIVSQLNEDNTLNYAPQMGCLYLTIQCLGDTTRVMAQQTVITAKTGNTLTLQSPLYFSGWKQSLSPRVWAYGPTAVGGANAAKQFVRNVGLRNFKITPTWTAFTSGGPVSYGSIQFFRATRSWVEGITFNGCDSGCTSANESSKITYRHNYLFNSRGAATSNVSSLYGFVGYLTTDLAIYNNIIQQIQAPVIFNGQVNGAVVAYNFIRNNVAAWCGTAPCPPNPWTHPWNWHALWPSHSGGVNNVLMEGNDANSLIVENLHGNTCCYTVVRNLLSGREPNNGVTTINRYTNALDLQMLSSRFSQALGNVLGQSGWHNNYESSSGSHGIRGISFGGSVSGESAIYRLGQRDGNGETCCSLGSNYDAVVESSFYRWGNFDTVTGGVRWCGTSTNTGWATNCGPNGASTEVPSGQFVPVLETVPTSFVFPSKPSWFGSVVWPPIGPNVTGGNVSGYSGYANKIPARVCAESLGMPDAGTGSILNFTLSTCYSTQGGDTTPPAAPTGVTISTNGENG